MIMPKTSYNSLNNQLIPLSIQKVINLHIKTQTTERYISREFTMLKSIKGIIDVAKYLDILGQPYRLTEGRLVYIKSGSAKIKIDLRDIEFYSEQFIIVSAGTVIQLTEISSDFDICIMAFPNDLMSDIPQNELLQEYIIGRLFIQLDLKEDDINRITQMLNLIWAISNDTPFVAEQLKYLILVLFYQLNIIRSREQKIILDKKTSRQEDIFNSFIKMLNESSFINRNVSYYADQLFIVPRYFSSVIKQVSGKNASQWINEAVVQEAKLMLNHTNKLIYQIADELNFPSSTFFCKFFKRMTGLTPEEYRSKKGINK